MSVWGVRYFGGGVGGGSVDEDGQDRTEGGGRCSDRKSFSIMVTVN